MFTKNDHFEEFGRKSKHIWFFPITPPNLNTFSLNKNCDGCLGITKSKIFKMAESSQVRKKKKKKKIAFFVTRIDKLISWSQIRFGIEKLTFSKPNQECVLLKSAKYVVSVKLRQTFTFSEYPRKQSTSYSRFLLDYYPHLFIFF